jgi:hypothetical protein
MEHHLEHDIRLSEESEYKSLYSWFLQEFTKEGKSVGHAVIPWAWSFWFTASQFEYIKSIELKNDADADDEWSAGELIRATLKPDSHTRGGRAPRFSMLGTDRPIKDFSVSIRRLDDDQTPERCKLWGIVSYTADFDFEDEAHDDCLGLDVALRPKNFDELCRLIQSGGAHHNLTVHVQGVSGFYSEWSPSVRTDNVKVLTSHVKDQPVAKPDGCSIEPPRVGAIQRFGLTFNRRSVVALSQAAEPKNVEDSDDESPHEQPSHTPEQQLYATTLQALARAQESFAQLRIVLWVIAALVAAGLFFK